MAMTGNNATLSKVFKEDLSETISDYNLRDDKPARWWEGCFQAEAIACKTVSTEVKISISNLSIKVQNIQNPCVWV